jgi:hypothetical protein
VEVSQVSPVCPSGKRTINEDEYGAFVEWYWQGKTYVLVEKRVPVPYDIAQTPRGLAWNRTGASAVKRRRLTARPTAPPLKTKTNLKYI